MEISLWFGFYEGKNIRYGPRKNSERFSPQFVLTKHRTE